MAPYIYNEKKIVFKVTFFMMGPRKHYRTLPDGVRLVADYQLWPVLCRATKPIERT